MAGATLAKRRGLVIVKKKKDEQEFKKEEQKPSTSERPSLSMIFSNADENLKKKKKEKKALVATKKESVEKMDFLESQDFGDISLDDEDEVVLPDFSVKEKGVVQNTPKKPPNFLRQNNSINFGEVGIQRRSRKSRQKEWRKRKVKLLLT